MEPFHPSAVFSCLVFELFHRHLSSSCRHPVLLFCVPFAAEKPAYRESSRLKRLRRKCTEALIRYERLHSSKKCFKVLGPRWNCRATACQSGAYHSSWKSLGIRYGSSWLLNLNNPKLVHFMVYIGLMMRYPCGRLCHCGRSSEGDLSFQIA